MEYLSRSRSYFSIFSTRAGITADSCLAKLTSRPLALAEDFFPSLPLTPWLFAAAAALPLRRCALDRNCIELSLLSSAISWLTPQC